jgi:hypothetical protein
MVTATTNTLALKMNRRPGKLLTCGEHNLPQGAYGGVAPRGIWAGSGGSIAASPGC